MPTTTTHTGFYPNLSRYKHTKLNNTNNTDPGSVISSTLINHLHEISLENGASLFGLSIQHPKTILFVVYTLENTQPYIQPNNVPTDYKKLGKLKEHA